LNLAIRLGVAGRWQTGSQLIGSPVIQFSRYAIAVCLWTLRSAGGKLIWRFDATIGLVPECVRVRLVAKRVNQR